MAAGSIFISYRRDDAAGYARAVADRVSQQFGADRVFMDVEDIGAGRSFEQVIERAVGEATVLLVLIGSRWRGERSGQPARIAEPTDLVRREVATALAKGVRVVPVLLDAAAMPDPAELPEDVRALTTRQALELRNSHFGADMQNLLDAVRQTLDEAAPAPIEPPRSRRALAMVALAAGVIAAALVALWLLGKLPQPEPAAGAQPASAASAASAAAARPARAAINGEWQAEVNYDWPGARHVERFVFAGEGAALHGSASFLGVPRGIVAGGVEPEGLSFSTRTVEVSGAAPSDTVHRYRGRLERGELRLVMQTEGGSTPHVPVEFVARRAPR